MCVCVCVCVCVCLSDFAEVLILSSILESQQIISEVEKSEEITKACYLEIWRKIGEGETAESHCLQAAGITAKRWMMWAEDHCSSSLHVELQRFHEV